MMRNEKTFIKVCKWYDICDW